METDWAVGQVMEALEKHGLANNTLLIFTADNGHCPYTGLKPFLDAGHWVSQRFRGFKPDIWEGGHRIPFIARWPGQVKAGSTCGQLICLTDLMASCADLLAAKLPDNAGEDSISILPAPRLPGRPAPRGGRPSFGQWPLLAPPGEMEAGTVSRFGRLESTVGCPGH